MIHRMQRDERSEPIEPLHSLPSRVADLLSWPLGEQVLLKVKEAELEKFLAQLQDALLRNKNA